ncbi:hypothetical protein [Pseudacidovorax sp. RU35E]|uniref:hypothetical protein n=1 Tax=Pseudacidovorax sp. RU35E TaxID=1907403 RepID=UPI00095533A1|nr:hypothetical protein [Pseudacidovorax sp. RU35E]SIR06903.1 hypothetical protein SAMN05880557_107305 [Pseudacidovorax sp. RU35E]
MTDALATSPIIGLEKTIEDPRTRAQLGYHTLYACQIGFQVRSTVATLRSYTSHQHAVEGAAHVSLIQVQLPGLPVGDVDQWIYAQLMESASEKNILAGAAAVREVI